MLAGEKKIQNSTLFSMHQNFCYLKSLENKRAEENLNFLFDFFLLPCKKYSTESEALSFKKNYVYEGKKTFQKKLCYQFTLIKY